MIVGPRQLAQHERVEPIGLPARDTEPVTRGRDLVRMQRQHPQPRIQQPLDQQPVRPLDRDQRHLHPHQHPAQRGQALLIVRVRRREKLRTPSRRPRARRASPTPSRSRHTDTPSPPSSIRSPSQRPDPEVPLRMLIDKALAVRGYVLLPLAAPHHRRDGLVFGRPSTKGKQSWPSPGGGRGNHSMSYERSHDGRRLLGGSDRAEGGPRRARPRRDQPSGKRASIAARSGSWPDRRAPTKRPAPTPSARPPRAAPTSRRPWRSRPRHHPNRRSRVGQVVRSWIGLA